VDHAGRRGDALVAALAELVLLNVNARLDERGRKERQQRGEQA
jgi:hypothetical protein